MRTTKSLTVLAALGGWWLSACSKDGHAESPVAGAGGVSESGGAEDQGGTTSASAGEAPASGGKAGSGRSGSNAGGRAGSGQGEAGDTGAGSAGRAGGRGGASSTAQGGAGPARGGGPSACSGADWAFCETFDRPTATPGPRSGDLDPSRWSVGRIAPQLATGDDCASCTPGATVGTCRSGVAQRVYPDEDTLICDASAGIKSNYLLTAVASQNYGVNSYRIRQPFDFTNRVGTIAFDVEAYTPNSLLGWASVGVFEDPTPTPSITDYEYGPLPKNGVKIEFITCEASERVGVAAVRTFKDYQQTHLEDPEFVAEGDECLSVKAGQLNHIEVSLSKTHLEVYGSDVSSDGVNFPKFRRLYAAKLDLPFERGYVSLTAHNHATLKYSEGEGDIDAWVVRWDNVGFDGPVVANTREYSLGNSLKKADGGSSVNVGYRLSPSEPLHFELPNVDVANVTRARLVFTAYYPEAGNDNALRYKVNGGAWHDRPLDAGEKTARNGDDQAGAINQIIELDPSELRAGTNSFDVEVTRDGGGFAHALANIDLVLTTE